MMALIKASWAQGKLLERTTHVQRHVPHEIHLASLWHTHWESWFCVLVPFSQLRACTNTNTHPHNHNVCEIKPKDSPHKNAALERQWCHQQDSDHSGMVNTYWSLLVYDWLGLSTDYIFCLNLKLVLFAIWKSKNLFLLFFYSVEHFILLLVFICSLYNYQRMGVEKELLGEGFFQD